MAVEFIVRLRLEGYEPYNEEHLEEVLQRACEDFGCTDAVVIETEEV